MIKDNTLHKYRIAHISDIHYRGGQQRHKEYRDAFTHFFRKCHELDVTHIVITGDIFHTKTQGITPEVIDELTWFFRSCAATASTHIMLGNHDGNLTNLNRQDAISPIVNAIDSDQIFLYKESCVYAIDEMLNICVFSCFDEENWDDVKPEDGKLNIALYHGSVVGSMTDQSWYMESSVDVSFFNGFDFVMLGDIHKMQFLDDGETELLIDESELINYPDAEIIRYIDDA